MSQLQVGDQVTWSSQSRGSRTVKTGTVVFQLTKADLAPWKIADSHFPGHKRMFDGGRIHLNGVLVEVRQPGSRAKPKLYMPWPNTIQKAEPTLPEVA